MLSKRQIQVVAIVLVAALVLSGAATLIGTW